jgi:peptide/nickel transport system ATP-binding protein
MDIRKSVIELIIKKYGDDVYPVVTRTQKEQRKLLEINSLEKSYAKTSKVLDGISFSLEEGKNGGFIGRSGVGKTTLLKCIAGIEPFNKGVLMWEGKEFNPFPYRFQGEVQLLWQDPYVSLNPYLMSKDIIVEPLGNIKDAKDKLLEIIETVGLVEDSLYKYPWELSGGQCQRVALARSLIKRPRLLLLDEPFSGLYPPDRRKLTHVLKKFCSEKGITLLVASHDLTVVETLTNQVWVLDKGMIVEQGEPQKVFINPAHSETVALVEASKRFSNLLNR